MSEESKKSAQEATKFFKEVSEKSEKFSQTIPDKQLGEKLRKVSESAEQVVKHITERSGQGG
jgi:hypothetical protein